MKLTIGMASYNNFPEVWFTIQALRMYHDLTDTEILVIDNYGDDRIDQFIKAWCGSVVRYVRYTERQGTAAAKNRVFQEAQGEWVICMDSHVMLAPGVVKRMRDWTIAHPGCSDLLHGPLLYDDLAATADAMNDEWRGNMWGTWRTQSVHSEADPYDIPMHGCGLMVCRRDAWLGFNTEFRGFGGEEGYLHTKFRQAGRRVVLLPWLRWLHHFHTVSGQCSAPYAPLLSDMIHNYEVGFAELGLDPAPIREHFGRKTE